MITATTSVGGEPPTALSSGGLTGVWAEENTRESIFAAFKRKETFGTSGVRIKVRMFAGWNYPKDMTKQADWVKAAYDGGVPMGGDLTHRQEPPLQRSSFTPSRTPTAAISIASRSSRSRPRTARARRRFTTWCGAATASPIRKPARSLPSAIRWT